MNIWDTAGQERFDSVNKMYFRDADAAIVVYDITDMQSFEKVEKWVKQLIEFKLEDGSQQIHITVVGNKSDLFSEQAVSSQKATEYARSIGTHAFECSAKDNTCIDNVFEQAAKKLHERDLQTALIQRQA